MLSSKNQGCPIILKGILTQASIIPKNTPLSLGKGVFLYLENPAVRVDFY